MTRTVPATLPRPTSTQVGLVRDSRHRYSWNGGTLMPSVTTILGVKDKPGLVGWAKRETAACAVRNLPMLARMAETGGPTAAVEWLKRIPDFRRDAAADLGTRVHAAAEALAKGQAARIDPEVEPFVAAYVRDFLERFEPRILGSETLVANLRHEYGGTADLWAEIDGETWLLDLKTGSGVYPDVALQLAGLARAQFIGRPGDPEQHALPVATRFGVVHVRPEGARLVPVVVDRAAVAAFLDARRLFAWDAGPARMAVGEPVAPPEQITVSSGALALPTPVEIG
ncbi:MAG TPA: hypothetical protein VKR30_05495 [Candidatus Limnocylindrales bacterium]|nr:hypothetical protein [Candidatus Limnocylindrales bacterium]